METLKTKKEIRIRIEAPELPSFEFPLGEGRSLGGVYRLGLFLAYAFSLISLYLAFLA